MPRRTGRLRDHEKIGWQIIFPTCVKYEHPDHSPDCDLCRQHGVTENILCALTRMDQDEGPDDPLRIPDAAHSCGFSSHLVGGILASRPAKGKLSKQKGPMLLARTLCLLASQGSTGFSRLLMGSTTEKVAREMPCSVMTLKQEHVIRLPLEKELADIETHLRRGKELLQKKMIESAIAQFEYCIRRNALFIPAWEELAGVYRNTGKKNEARKCEEMAAHICKYLRENQKEDMQK